MQTKTLILIILDESGSMYHQREKVIDSFNKFIEEQKDIKTDFAKLYLVKFNSIINTVFHDEELNKVKWLKFRDYQPQQQTALYDAICKSIKLVQTNKNEDERVICLIMTDGKENCSTEYTIHDVRSMITENESKGDWTFLYIGKEPNLWAEETGMSLNNTRSDTGFVEDMTDGCEAISTLRLSQFKQSQNLLQERKTT